MNTEEMLEFLEDKDNARLLLCSYQHPGAIMRGIAAKLRAAEELAKTLGYYDSPFMNRELKDALAKYRAAGGTSADKLPCGGSSAGASGGGE